MQGGDISNEVAPRLLFVFEGTLATVPSKTAEAKEKLQCRLKRWAAAAELWEISEQASILLWDVAWRYNFRFDIVTYKPAGFARALKDRLDEEGLPAAKVWHSSPQLLAKKLAFMPDVAYVYDSDPTRLFTYGGRGVQTPVGLAGLTSLW